MAIIYKYTRPDDGVNFDCEKIDYHGTAVGWILENIPSGCNFEVYEGELIKPNEISRDEKRVCAAAEVSVFLMPAGELIVPLLISLVVSVVISLVLAPKKPRNVNRDQQSPNNSLSDRRNKARPNQRICDLVGSGTSVPDIIQRELSKYESNEEFRVGYYGVCRNRVQLDDLKDGDSLILNTEGASAGIYYPFNSPNNSLADVQIGEAINESVVGVYSSSDALGQTLKAPNEELILLDDSLLLSAAGYIEDPAGTIGFDSVFKVGDNVILDNIYGTRTSGEFLVGTSTTLVIAVTAARITFDITGDLTWPQIDPSPGFIRDLFTGPRIILNKSVVLGPFRNTTIKADNLLVNCYAPSGMYKENSRGRSTAAVSYNVIVQKLNDQLNPVGAQIITVASLSGSDSNEKGTTTETSLGGLTYVEWSLQRITPKDYNYNGNILDEIKLKDVFGTYEIDVTDFGNITTIQTKIRATAQTTAIRERELTCKYTELVNKYQAGVFSAELTPNTQAMQSLIRLALDPYVGRRTQEELDLVNIEQTQADVETYFDSAKAGGCSYTFDSTNISAQEIFFTLSDAIFCKMWREGRVLKSWFERPQTIPQMVFTHRSKQPGNETWSREFAQSKRKDSIEFKYTSEILNKQETLYHPANRTGTNPLKIDIPGIKGLAQATWRMMREYNKLIYQEIAVEFSSTQEGRFVSPFQMISVVKGSRVGTYDGYITAVSGLTLTLSQEVSFTLGDDHFILLKRRDGTVESIPVTDAGESRKVTLGFIPTELIYTANDELKTEFSFGNEARLSGQLMIPFEINPSNKQYVGIKAINYTDQYYKDDPVQTVLGSFDNSFDEGFN